MSGQIRSHVFEEFDPSIPKILPHDKVYSIQVGYKLFRLSGASLSSDAPSYFTKFFDDEDNMDQILFIDRNPTVFEKIYNHLQGYHINVETDYEYIHLWLDSYYFGLKRLQRILNSDYIFCTIGSQSFKIDKELLTSSGNYPNYFLINYDSQLTDNLAIIEAKNIIRPPPQRPPTVVNRSPALFSDLLEILRGNPLVIRDDDHRNILVRECKYYFFLELEQRIVKHSIVNSVAFGGQEIIIGMSDINPKGLTHTPGPVNIELPLRYRRPRINEPARVLTFQMNNNEPFDPSIKLILNKREKIASVQLTGKTRAKFLLTFKSVSDDYRNEPTESDKSTLLVGLRDSKATINGIELQPDWFLKLLGLDEITNSLDFSLVGEPATKKRKINGSPAEADGDKLVDGDNLIDGDKLFNGDKLVDDDKLAETEKPERAEKAEKAEKGDIIEIKIIRALFRVIFRGTHSRLHAVSIEGITDERKHYRDNLDFL